MEYLLLQSVPRSPIIRREHQRGEQMPRFYPVKPRRPIDPKSPRKQKTRHSENPPVEMPVGWVLDSVQHRTRTQSNASQSATYVRL